MKRIAYLALVLVFTSISSCTDFLEEEPKSLLTAKYLETPSGVWSALYSTYSDLRYFYGGESALSMTVAGTDEFQKGPDGSEELNLYSNSGLLTNGQVSSTWNWGYTAINSANAVLEYAHSSGMPEEDADLCVAEAKYLRALWYFLLVQMYGDLPLNLEFITEPSTEAYRTPAAEVYQAIVTDLKEAIDDLPNIAPQPGRATAAAAHHLLAKVYLAKATHATAKEDDDYQNAFNHSTHLIDNAGAYGLALLKDFADVHTPRNEHSSEILFTVERNTDIVYNDLDPDANGNKNNRSSFFFRPNYSAIVKGLIRDIPNGRPWHRVRPTNYLLEVVFQNRDDDTRYHKTFQTVWLVNDPDNVETPGFVAGDTAIWLPGSENHPPARALRIFKPSEYYDNVSLSTGEKQTLSIYPSLKKYDDIDRPTVADASVRPFIVFKFSETYLIAAEAAMYLNRPGEARYFVNVVRARAGFNANRSDAANAAAISRLTSTTPSLADFDEGINFLLEERSRELCGEYMRWFDLARTRNSSGESMLYYRLTTLTPDIPCKNTIQKHHILRPVPQDSQIDLTTNEFPQNPGYGS